jgi:hypothetical protein
MFGWLKRLGTQEPTPPIIRPQALERRIAARHPCDLQVNDRLVVSIGSSSWPAVVHDISTTGIGLILGIRHDPGTSLPLDLYCTSSGFSRTMRVTIVRTMRLPDGHWFCGCAFEEQLDHRELNALL